MAVTQVRVLGAIGGQELLAARPFPCAALAEQVRAALGSRPSQPVALFHKGALVDGDFEGEPDRVVELTAVVCEALEPEERARLLLELQGADASEVLDVWQGFSTAARDDRTLVVAAAQVHDRALRYASQQCRDDKEIILAAVRCHGRSLQYAGKALKGDEEVVLAAVEQSDAALHYASDSLKTDEAFVVAAVTKNGGALQFVAESLKCNKNVALAAVRQHRAGQPNALVHASKACKSDKAILSEAVRRDPTSIRLAGEDEVDREAVLEAVRTDPMCLEHASPVWRDDLAVVLEAVRRDPRCLEHASEARRNDQEVVLAAAGTDPWSVELADARRRSSARVAGWREWLRLQCACMLTTICGSQSG